MNSYLKLEIRLVCREFLAIKEHVYSSRKYLDIAFSGFIGSLEKRGGGDIRNKYGVGEFISWVHFALRSLRSRTLFTLFYGLILGLKISQPDLRKSAKLQISIYLNVFYSI